MPKKSEIYKGGEKKAWCGHGNKSHFKKRNLLKQNYHEKNIFSFFSYFFVY
jgi:hypothetical protein